MFEDRTDAGKKLAAALEKFREDDAVILAVPRGGVPLAYEIARALGKECSILVSRKLPFPSNPESGFGAVAEDGTLVILDDAARGLSEAVIDRIVAEQRRVIEQRISTLRGNRTLPPIERRTVILTDDGIAMGSTMRAAVAMCRKKNAGKIVVAVPVAGRRTAREFTALADELIVLECPADFYAVAQVYRHWRDLADEDVIEIMSRA